MIYMMFLLLVLFPILAYLLVLSYKKAKIEAVMQKTVPQSSSEHQRGWKFWRRWFDITDKATRDYLIIAAGAVVGGTFSIARGGNFVLLAGIGAFIPFVIQKQMLYAYEKRYRADGLAALKFLHGVASADGSLEEWVEEVIPRLNGPLKAQFQLGYDNYLRGVPITRFLEALIRDCPDSGINLVFSGILREHRQGVGKMKTFVDSALKDMENQQRFIRVMGEVRKSGAQLLMYIYCFPVFFYFLFADTVNAILDKHPISNVALVVAVAGYALLGWWGTHVTRTKA